MVEKIDLLRATLRYVKERKPYRINAIVILPDHLHCIWTLPPGARGLSVYMPECRMVSLAMGLSNIVN
ncbi:hypothetical protein [Methylobacter sp. BBA5.1]|uniref:hypothetical protein n=1 Tax=Methylobacter sp. BBA5.1 TaxID=1495064 RepID=UPI000A6CB443|nr:hypothetical protein [Methylobacter sp. BBA5.1]